VQADRRFERERAGRVIAQIERAGIRIEPLGDQLDDIAEGLAEAVRSRDDLGNVGQQRDAVRNGRSPAGKLPEQRCGHGTEVRGDAGKPGEAFLDGQGSAPVEQRRWGDQNEPVSGSIVR